MDNMDILAMISAEGEKVPFNKAPKARGQVESWLGLVQTAMRETLQRLLKNGLNDYTQAESRKDWVLTHFG
jgi:dynein heavy chain